MVQNICKKVEGFLSYRGFPKSGRTNPGLPYTAHYYTRCVVMFSVVRMA